MMPQREKDILLDRALENQIEVDSLDDELVALIATASQVNSVLADIPEPPHGLRPGRSACLTAATQTPQESSRKYFLPFPRQFRRALSFVVPLGTVMALVVVLGVILMPASDYSTQTSLPGEESPYTVTVTSISPAQDVIHDTATVVPEPVVNPIEKDIDDAEDDTEQVLHNNDELEQGGAVKKQTVGRNSVDDTVKKVEDTPPAPSSDDKSVTLQEIKQDANEEEAKQDEISVDSTPDVEDQTGNVVEAEQMPSVKPTETSVSETEQPPVMTVTVAGEPTPVNAGAQTSSDQPEEPAEQEQDINNDVTATPTPAPPPVDDEPMAPPVVIIDELDDMGASLMPVDMTLIPSSIIDISDIFSDSFLPEDWIVDHPVPHPKQEQNCQHGH